MENKAFLLAVLVEIETHVGLWTVVAAAVPGLEAAVADVTAFWCRLV